MLYPSLSNISSITRRVVLISGAASFFFPPPPRINMYYLSAFMYGSTKFFILIPLQPKLTLHAVILSSSRLWYSIPYYIDLVELGLQYLNGTMIIVLYFWKIGPKIYYSYLTSCLRLVESLFRAITKRWKPNEKS